MSATGDFRASGGFTLLEVLVVLAIAAMTATLVFPQMDRALHILSLRQASLALAADLRRVRADAVASGHPQGLVLDAEGGGYRGGGRHRAAPRDIAYSGAGEVLFYPDGSSSGGEIAIETRRTRAVVRVDPTNGGLEVGNRQ